MLFFPLTTVVKKQGREKPKKNTKDDVLDRKSPQDVGRKDAKVSSERKWQM